MSPSDYWPFALYTALVAVVAAGMIGVSSVLGQRHKDRATGEPYESGVLQTGSGRLRMSIRFYLVAILFVIFDLEVIYIFAWAISIRELGWSGYWGVLVFIGILVAALIYEWRMGALDWSRPRSPRGRARLSGKEGK
ncbi:MAG: NADH-quinone oxidoreductase subunit A [Verrucomicrobiota bacterium]